MIFNLGVTNAIYADSLGIGLNTAGGGNNTLRFNPIFTNGIIPTAYIRGTNGGRMSYFAVGVDSGVPSVNSRTRAAMDFSGGRVDLKADTMVLGKNRKLTSINANKQDVGVLTFRGGTIDVNTLLAGWQQYSNDMYVQGTINMSGDIAPAKLVVNTVLGLGYSQGDSTGTNGIVFQGFGQITIGTNSTALINQINCGSFASNNVVSIAAGGALVLSNTIASPSQPLNRFSMAGGRFGINATKGVTNVASKFLTTSGASNVVDVLSVSGISTYPAQLPIITYTNYNTGTYNFVLSNVPPSVVGYLSNNVANSSIDLYLTSGPTSTLPTLGIQFLTGNSFKLSWPSANIGWTLQAQTNTLNVGLSTNWVNMPSSASTNSVTVTNDPTKGAVFYRLLSP
jgi:hypothetical protein